MFDDAQDYVDDLLRRFPGPLVLQRSRAKWIGMLLISVAFTAGGVWMVITKGDWKGWLVLAFFGLGILISILNLLPGASALTLDKNGFKASSMFRSHETAWRDASGFAEFNVGPLGAAKMVVYDDANAKGRAVAGFNAALSGRNAGLPDTYGLSAADLVRLMTRWRERAEQPA